MRSCWSADAAAGRRRDAQHRALFIRLLEESQDFAIACVGADSGGDGVVDVAGRDQVPHDRHQPGVLDAFVASRRIIDGHGRPQRLADLQAFARNVKAFVEFIHSVCEELRHGGAERGQELGLQQVAQRRMKRLAALAS